MKFYGSLLNDGYAYNSSDRSKEIKFFMVRSLFNPEYAYRFIKINNRGGIGCDISLF